MASLTVGFMTLTASPALSKPLRHQAVSNASAPVLYQDQILKQQKAEVVLVPKPDTYTVQENDTLSSIAQHFGIDWRTLWWANHHLITDPDSILPGWKLTVPSAAPVPSWLATAALNAIGPPAPAIVTTSYNSAPVPEPTASGTYSYGMLEALWVSAGGPAWAEASAATIAECESGGNPNAYNPSGASGLWQILGQVVSGNIFNPMVNALNAVAKFRASGNTFAQWVCQA
jgi:LysM repeat protein